MTRTIYSLLYGALFLWTNSYAASSVIEGQIFIATKGQQTFKLPLVNVVAVPEKKLQSILDSRAQSYLAKIESLTSAIEQKRREIADSTSSLQATDSTEKPPMIEVDELSQVCRATIDVEAYLKCVRTPDGERASNRIRVLVAQYKTEFEQRAAMRRVLRDLMKQHRNTVASLRTLPDADSFADSAIATSKSDADGKFTLPIPSAGRVVILANSSRDVGGKTEKYQWAVVLPLIPGRKNSVFLANDNLLDTGCSTCIQTIKATTYPDLSGPPENIRLSSF